MDLFGLVWVVATSIVSLGSMLLQSLTCMLEGQGVLRRLFQCWQSCNPAQWLCGALRPQMPGAGCINWHVHILPIACHCCAGL